MMVDGGLIGVVSNQTRGCENERSGSDEEWFPW